MSRARVVPLRKEGEATASLPGMDLLEARCIAEEAHGVIDLVTQVLWIKENEHAPGTRMACFDDDMLRTALNCARRAIASLDAEFDKLEDGQR